MKKPVSNLFIKGMDQDSLPSMQPEGTYRYMLNGKMDTLDHSSFGVSNEEATELCFNLPDGYELVGGGFIQERDSLILFSTDQNGHSEIGIGNLRTCVYTRLVNDSKFKDKLCFTNNEWIRPEIKRIQPCNEIIAYWSNGGVYRRINIDASNCDYKNADEFELFKCSCGPIVETEVSEYGGQGLLVGAYQAVAQLEDNDGNTTNWFFIDYPVYLTSEKNAPGDISDQSVQITIRDIDEEYDYVNIGIVSTINNITTAKFITKQPRKIDGIVYNYVGQTTEEYPIDLEEIFTKNPGYIKGKDLIQKDGRLILYNLLGEFNLDYQEQANEIFSNYKVLRVPAKEAHKYSNLQRDEVYRIGIVFHFCNGSSSPVYHIPGRPANDYDLEELGPGEELNCSDCKTLPRWRVQNTAEQTELFCNNAIDDSKNSFRLLNHTPPVQEVTQVNSDNANNQLPAEFYDLAFTATGIPCEGNCLGQEQTQNCPNGDCNGSIPNETDYKNATHIPYEPCKDCGTPDCASGDCGGTGGCGGGDCGEGEIFIDGSGSYENRCFKDVDYDELIGKFSIFGNLFPSCTPDVYITNCGGKALLTATPCSGGSCTGLNGETLVCSSSGEMPICRTQVETIATQGSISMFADYTAAANDCIPEPILDDNGCIIGYKPVLYSKGNLAYWESEDTYPTNLKCDGSFLYGGNAGAPIRDHKMPNVQLEPHFLSFQNGVPHHDNYENKETVDGYVHLLTLDFCNITKPKNLPMPLCKEKPFSIVYAKRDDFNKSVLASGLFTGTFQGNIFGREYAVPKNGVNSLEYFDRYLQSKNSTNDAHERETHGGYNGSFPIYNFHSPETNFKQPRLSSQTANIELEYFGSGWMYGWVAKGKKQESIDGIEMNNKGMRQSIHLNHYDIPLSDKRVRIKNPDNPCCKSYTFNIKQESFKIGQCSEGQGPGSETLVYQISLNVSTSIPANKISEMSIVGSAGNLDLWEQYNQGGGGQGSECLEGALGSSFTFTTQGASLTENVIATFPGGGPVQGAAEIQYSVSVTTTDGCTYTSINTLITELSINEVGSKQTSVIVESDDCDYIFKGDDTEGLIIKCISGISYVDPDSVLEKGEEFSLPMLNLKREQSVAVEFTEQDERLRLRRSIEDVAKNLDEYNGAVGADLSLDGTSDGSFIGDLFIHERPIYNAAAWYGTLKYDNRRQYGRLEALRYQRLYDGTEEALLCGNVTGIGGDTFIGPYSLRRTSYISDKVGHHPVPPEKVSLEGFGGLVARGLGIQNEGEAADVLGHTCDCGKPPKNAEREDCRNWAGLRYPERVNTWLGPGTELPPRWESSDSPQRVRPSCEDHRTQEWDYPRDVFYPGLLKTNVTFWTESQVNIWNRQTGDEELSELAYPKLGKFELDPAMPKYTRWDETFLGRFYVELERASKFRLLTFTIICYFFLIVFPILIAALTIGNGIISAITGSGIAYIAIRFWTSRTGSNIRQFLKEMLGFDNCLGDKFEIDRDGWVKDYAPAYHGYNWDFSKLNDLEQYLGMPDNYNTCDCLADVSQKMYYSNQQIIGSLIDSYRNFKPNNFIDIPADAGQVQRFFYRGNQFFAHTTDNVWNLYSNETTMQVNNETVYLGRGDLFNSPRPLMGGIPEGWMGTTDPNAAINTPFGYIFVDEESKGIFIFSGESAPMDITQVGMRNFFKENLGFKLKEQFPEWDLKDEKSQYGIGYSLALDPRHNRLLVTKVDYQAKNPSKLKYRGKGVFTLNKKPVYVTDSRYFDNVSFTASFDLLRKTWISFHSYVPKVYFWDRDHMYSYYKNGIWRHDSRRDEYQTYYGDYFPFILDYTARGQNLESLEPESIILDTEASRWDDVHKQFVYNLPITYTDLYVYTSNQATGKLDLENTETEVENRLKAITESIKSLRVVRKDNTWRISGFTDKVKDKNKPLFTISKDLRYTDKEILDENIFDKPNKFNSSIFFDKQFNVRLIFNNLQFKSIRLITKLGLLISKDRQE